MDTKPRKPGQPYCEQCGYDLEGLTESARCPECGRPLVEVLRRTGHPQLDAGKRFTSRATVMGMPLVHFAVGPRDGELRGKARGFIAIGDDAMGVIAIGGAARGIVSFGGMSIGVFSLGGMSLGLVTALGGGAISLGLAVGGGAIGGVAKAGGALGFIADGGGALGYYARGGGAFGVHALGQNPGANSAEAQVMFDQLSWLLGTVKAPTAMAGSFFYTAGIALGAALAVGGLLALWGYLTAVRPIEEEQVV